MGEGGCHHKRVESSSTYSMFTVYISSVNGMLEALHFPINRSVTGSAVGNEPGEENMNEVTQLPILFISHNR